MVEVPEKLKIKGINFVLLKKGEKAPFETGWQNKKIEYNDERLITHLKNGGNYGVRGGGSQMLVIIDFDNEQVQESVCEEIPRTFTVKTGSGLLHKYFFSDKCDSFKIFDEEMGTLADIQGEGKQVVGAGSIHPNGSEYEIVEDEEVAFLPYAEIKALMMKHDKKPHKEVKEESNKPKFDFDDSFLDKLKSKISMEDVLDSFGIDTSRNPTTCPKHDSKGGKCLGFNNETAHCFHCEGSWNIFSLVKEVKDCSFKEALSYLAQMSGLEDELEISRQKYIEELRMRNEGEREIIRSQYLELVKDKKFNDASEILAQYILSNNHIYTTKDDTKNEMWIYNEGIYQPQGKSECKIILRELLDKWYSAYVYNQVINKIEADTMIESDWFFNQNHINEVPVLNGLLDIYTRELKDFTPDKIFFNKLPITYDPHAKAERIDDFLTSTLASEDDKEVFYELGGFTLLKEYKFEKAFMFVGNGRNGKDKSLELLKRMIGVENCCSVPLASIVPDSFIVSEFFGKMANLAGEINNHDLKDTSEFKALTGRSLKSAPRKFLKPITFVNYAKFIFACNELPFVYDNSRGFWDRWVLLEFPYTFVPKEEYDKAEDKTNLKIRDENIIEKITTPEEMSGLLNRFLDGLDRLLFNKNFSSTKGSIEIKNFWIRKSNSVMAFCLDLIEDDYDSFISKKDFRKNYSKYCKTHKIPQKSDYVIRRTLEELFGGIEENKEVSGKFERVWGGIKWKK